MNVHQAIGYAVSQVAASRVTDDVMIEVVRAGFTGDQAKAVKSAAMEFLIRAPGYEERAVTHLSTCFDKARQEDICGLIAVAQFGAEPHP